MDPGFESSLKASSPEPLRLCGLCHKPFLKETSYNRHVLYCRRAQNRPRTRVRSCRACITAKVKCNFQPRCLRCTNKGLECVYDKARSAAAAAANAGATVTATHESQVADEQPAENLAPAFTPASLPDGDITSTLQAVTLMFESAGMEDKTVQAEFKHSMFRLYSASIAAHNLYLTPDRATMRYFMRTNQGLAHGGIRNMKTVD
ncbi:hypothetical protein V1527DRAFT_493494 [Lipomyces starkeyi]